MPNWIEGRNKTLLNLDEVLCFEIQQEKHDPTTGEKPSSRNKVIAYGTHRSKWGNAKITMFIGDKKECESRIDYLRAKLGLTGIDYINIA